MGNSKSSRDEVETYVHPRLGTIRRIQEPNKDQFIGYERVLENQKVYEDWVRQLRYVKREQAMDNMLFLPVEYKFKQTTYCGTGGMASLKYEDYLYSLAQQIKNRREIKRPFNEQELLYLFYNLVKAEALLQAMNRTIGDIKPQNIMVNEDGQAKIISQFSWPGQSIQLTSWEKDNERLFLSPQECDQRHKSRDAIRSNLHRNQSQVFSIGMTVLEVGTLRDCSYIYGQAKEYRFSEARVRQFLDIFESRYSKQCSCLVKQMMHPNPRKRWKAQRVYQSLKPYEVQILNLDEFVLKLQNSEYLPRIEREDKISIKRIGDSQHRRIDQSGSKLKVSEANSSYRQSLQRSAQKGSQYDSGREKSQSRQQSFPVYQQQQSHQVIRQNSNFLSPGSRIQQIPRESVEMRQNMTYSLPVNLNIDPLNRSNPQYLSQAMMSSAGSVTLKPKTLREKHPGVTHKSFLQQ